MKGDNFKLIDKGYNSQIFLYQNNLVLKMVDIRFSKQIKHLENEFQLMSSLDHPNILKVVGLKHNVPIKGISDPTSDIRRDVLIMEFANKGSLLSVIKTGIQLNVKKNFIIQLVDSFLYLHNQKGVAHRDIKLDNILVRNSLNNMTALISDFGFAIRNSNLKENKVEQGKVVQKQVGKKQLKQKSQNKSTKTNIKEQTKPFLVNSYKGTKKGYMAPQLHKLVQNMTIKSYDPFKADVFSFGVVLFCLIFEKLPFELSTKDDPIYCYISNNKWQQFWSKHKLNEQKYCDINLEQFKRLLERMLEQHPEKRITMKEVQESIFIQQIKSEVKIFKSENQRLNKQ